MLFTTLRSLKPLLCVAAALLFGIGQAQAQSPNEAMIGLLFSEYSRADEVHREQKIYQLTEAAVRGGPASQSGLTALMVDVHAYALKRGDLQSLQLTDSETMRYRAE